MSTVFYTIADENNLEWAQGLERSFKRFHPDIDFKIYGPEYVKESLDQDKDFFYKATPWIARDLLDQYSLAVKVDADSVVCAPLDRIINDTSYEIGSVRNYNQVDAAKFGVVSVWNIPAEQYVNCGLVAMRSKEFVEHWWTLCNTPFFHQYQYREQDLLNILFFYGNYRTACFDNEDEFYGLSSKQFWLGLDKEDEGIKLNIINQAGDLVKKMDIKVIHWAEGNTPQKMNFDMRFKPEVAKYLKQLTNYAKKA